MAKVIPAEQIMTACYYDEMREILELMGLHTAWVTDRTRIDDFVLPGGKPMADLPEMGRRLGFEVNGEDLLWEIAKQLHDSRR